MRPISCLTRLSCDCCMHGTREQASTRARVNERTSVVGVRAACARARVRSVQASRMHVQRLYVCMCTHAPRLHAPVLVRAL